MALKIEIVGLDWETFITVNVLVLGKQGLCVKTHRSVPRIVDFIAKMWNFLAMMVEGFTAFHQKRLSINN